MIEIEDIINKYEYDVAKNLNKENMNKIIDFLRTQKCDFILELLNDYLDLFIFEYDKFIEKYNKLNIKYKNNLLNEIKDDMNILEEFYN